ncbi:Sister chromatid cohesion C-terminus, putative [Leishmania lindenbergi]|uniref:Sister chromatid cohesion protein n=1 Tax=Leishmania lindenbergi TaxID=651832 RepID=A0AAW3ASY7_9TRYP
MSAKPVISLPPQPCLIAANESVNPVPKLLLSFPVPRLVSQLRLETEWARPEEEVPAGGVPTESSALPSWRSAELDQLSRGMQESAQQLLLTGVFSRFLQEQFHREAGQFHGNCGSADDSCSFLRCQGRTSAAHCVSRTVTRGLQGLLSSMVQRNTLLNVAQLRKQCESGTTSSLLPPGKDAFAHRVPLTRVPESESWVRSENAAGPSLRPRRSAELGSSLADTSTGLRTLAPADGKPSIPASGRRRASATTASTSTIPRVAASYRPRTTSESASLEALETSLRGSERTDVNSISFADFVRQTASDSGSGAVVFDAPLLLRFVSWLPLQVRPFEGIPSAQMTACLTALAASCTSAEEEAAVFSNSGLQELPWSARTWLCCQCLAHPHFPTEAVPAGLVGHTVDAFARVIRGVAALLLRVQQSADAAAVGVSAETSSKQEGDSSTVLGQRSAADRMCTTSSLHPWLEQLRGYLRSFAVMLCNRTVRLVPDTDISRLEELCYQCLFHVTRSCSKEVHLLYSTYIIDGAVHLYRCIWNCLQVERRRLVEVFFQRLPTSSACLTQRTYRVNYDGRTVLPLTVSMLAGAQSLVISGEVGELSTVETLQRQCSLWAGTFVHELLLRCASRGDRAEDTAAWAAAVVLAEDLTDLLGVPEWPGADVLLRTFVHALAQLCLSAESATTASAEALRPLAVDVVARVALKLFDERQLSVPTTILAEMERLRDVASRGQGVGPLVLQNIVCVPAPSPPAAADQQAWEHMCGATDKAAMPSIGTADSSLLGVMGSVYMAESQLIANPSTAADYAAVWFNLRAAQVTTWASLQDTDQEWISEAGLGLLVRWQRPPGGGDAPANWNDVCVWTQVISTQFSNSMLSLRTRHTLVSMLLSIFHLKDAQGVAVPVSDVVQRKALAHLARLTAEHPPLHRYLWPVVRQCVQDDSARVRESIVPLLLTMLNGATVTAAEGELTATDYSVTADGLTAEVVSSLLYLLNDKSGSVVSRTIAALDAFLTDDAYQCFFATPHGAPLLFFIEYKLLQLAAPDEAEAQRHRKDVVKHFLRRWVVTLGDAEGSLTGAHAQLAKELVALAVMVAPDYPHDLGEDNPLVQVLQGMHTYVTAYDPAGETSPSSTAASTAVARRRPRGYHIDGARLLHVMRCAARSLWTRYNCFHSTEDAVSCLAAMRALAQARGEWVQPLAEVLVQSIAYPPPPTSPLAKTPEALGGALLHMCQTLHFILKAPRLPLVSLDQLARSLTALLSKYVGPYQQRVIVASCSALCALITCGAKHRLSGQVNVPYLQLCYSLMNTYYTRVRGLLPSLATQPQSVAYTLRFLFLLSEFLRMYPGWRQHPPHPALVEESLVGHNAGATAPNALIEGPGIMANTYQLLEDVLGSCGSSSTRKGVTVIALRVVASLCMLDPTTYFLRAEGRIRDALRSHDVGFQLQGLSLLSDFLKEEDQRVEAAARQATHLDTTALILGSSGGGDASDTSSGSWGNGDGDGKFEAPLPGRRVKRMRHKQAAVAVNAPEQMKARGNARRAPLPHSSAAAHTEDFNSGMATWIFQQFHGDIARLSCGTPNSQVRSLCLRLFQQAAHGGLLPPEKYMQVIVALAADVYAPLRQQAAATLTISCEHHEVVGSSVGRGVELAFCLHHTCGVNLLRSAVVPDKLLTTAIATAVDSGTGGVLSGYSVHSSVYTLLHKRLRDSMITTLVRFFYQDDKARTWCEEHAQQLTDATEALAASSSSGVVFSLFHPLLFLCHLTLALATLPFPHENDVMHVLQQARTGLDLNGQAALDWLRDNEGSTAPPSLTDTNSSMVMRWKAIGALLLHYLRCSLKSEYHVNSAKLVRYRSRQNFRAATTAAQQCTASPMQRRAAHSAAMADLTARLERLVRLLEPALRLSWAVHPPTDVVEVGWHALSVELESALMEESADAFGECTPSRSTCVCGRAKRARVARPTRHATAPSRRKRQRCSLPRDTTSTDDSAQDDTESDEAATRSSSESPAINTPCEAAHQHNLDPPFPDTNNG